MRLLDALEGLPQVTVARMHGHAIGAGLLLALASDLRVADRNLVIRIPELTLGLPFAMGGIPRLVREIGIAHARDVVLTGRTINIAEAKEWGLVHRVGDSREETQLLVRELLRSPLPVQSMAKQAMHAAGRTLVSLDAMWADSDLVNLMSLEPESQESSARRWR
jgi:enoyl-CoA hydratase/carnithine racemase